MLTIVLALLAVTAVGLLMAGAAWLRPGWMILAPLLLAALLDVLKIGTDGLNLGILIHFDDVASVIALGTAMVILLRYRSHFRVDYVPCLILLTLIAIAFSRGVGEYGLKMAGNCARNLFFFLVPALAIMLAAAVLRFDAVRLQRWIIWIGSSLTALALLRWLGILPIPVDLDSGDDFRTVVRALPSDYAIPIGQACIASVYFALLEHRKSWWWVVALLFAGVTVALQHRSVWVATAAGLSWLLLRNVHRISPLRWISLGLLALAALGTVMVATPQLLVATESLLSKNYQETQSSNSTWEWRVKGYDQAFDRTFSGSFFDMLIGPPAGAVFNSGGNYASIHIHSRYVDTLAYYGIVGVVALLLWFSSISRKITIAMAAARSRAQRMSISCLQAMFIAQIIYLIPYFGGVLQGTILGLLWVASQQKDAFPCVGSMGALNRWTIPRNHREPVLTLVK